MNSPIASVHLKIFADYRQFYVWDPDLPDLTAPEDYSEEDLEVRVKTGPGVVVIQPIRDMEVPVDIQIFESEPEYDLGEWQHVVEAPLKLTRNRIEIHECIGDSLALLPVPSVHCAVRALFKGLGALSPDGLDGEDKYRVQIFPSTLSALKVIKKWTG